MATVSDLLNGVQDFELLLVKMTGPVLQLLMVTARLLVRCIFQCTTSKVMTVVHSPNKVLN